MFATSSPKTGAILLHCSSVCIATLVDNIASKNISGYQIPASYYAVKWVTVFGETGGDSLFYSSHRTYYNFSSLMPKTVKNCSTVNHSTRTATSAHDTRLLSRLHPQQFIHSSLELSRKFRMFAITVAKTVLYTYAVTLPANFYAEEFCDLGLCIIPNGFCTARSEIVLADRGIARPFSVFKHTFFYSWPRQ